MPIPRIRIAYLVSQYPTMTHTFVLREIRELRRIGFDIRVASIRASDRPFEQLTWEEQEEQRATFYIKTGGCAAASAAHLRILLSRPFSYLRGLVYALWLGGRHVRAALRNLLYFAEAVVLVGWMQREGLCHVHTHFSSTVVLLARCVLPIRTSATIHGSDEFSDPAKYHLKQKMASLDLLRTISEYGRGQLTSLGPSVHWNKVRVSRLGVDPEAYSPRPFRWNPSPFEILCVGRLVARKGFYVLFTALERLVREGRAVRLRIAGDGPERPGLERDAAERGLMRHVIFEGWQNTAGVSALYQQADIFALPSFAEGIPVVLMEAMATEIACVATSIAGIPELIRNDVDGLLVQPSNEEELAAALARLLDEPELRLRLGKSARQRVVECYDLGRNTAEFAAILGEIHGSEIGRGKSEC